MASFQIDEQGYVAKFHTHNDLTLLDLLFCVHKSVVCGADGHVDVLKYQNTRL